MRVEDPEQHQIMQRAGFSVFSTLYASRTVLRAYIEHPSALKLISDQEDSIHEVVVDNPIYEGIFLRQLPLLADILILRIYRDDSMIVPHGNTLIQMGDRLLISANASQVAAFKQRM